jgi:hypothetical protein
MAVAGDGNAVAEGTVVIDENGDAAMVEEVDESDDSAWVRYSGATGGDWVALEELSVAEDQSWIPS